MYSPPFAQPPQQGQSLTQHQHHQQHRQELAWLSQQPNLDTPSPLQPSALSPPHQQQHSNHHHHHHAQQQHHLEQLVELQPHHSFLQEAPSSHQHHPDSLPQSYRHENSLPPIPRYSQQQFPSSPLDPLSPQQFQAQQQAQQSPVQYHSNSGNALPHSPQQQSQDQQQPEDPVYHHATSGPASATADGTPIEVIPSHGSLAPPMPWGMVDYGGKDLFVAPEDLSMQPPVVGGFVNPLHLFTSPPSRPLSALSASSPTPSPSASLSSMASPSPSSSMSAHHYHSHPHHHHHNYHHPHHQYQDGGGDDSESFTGTDDDEVRIQLAGADPSYLASTPPLSPHSPGSYHGHHDHQHDYYSHHHHHHGQHPSQAPHSHQQGLIQSLASMTTASSPRSGPVSPFRVRVSGGSMSGHHDGSGLVQALTSADPYSRSTYGGFGHESHGHAPHHLHTTSPTMAIGGGGAHVDDGEGVTGGAEEEERLFQCDQCQKRFLRQYNLNAHLKTHSLERNHPCDQCPKSFLRPYDLSRHQRIHTKDKPYTCKICGLIFIRNDAIWRHYRKAHQGHPDVPTSRREKSLVSKAAAGMPSSAARQMMSSSPPPSFD